jgi:hypothetical protein
MNLINMQQKNPHVKDKTNSSYCILCVCVCVRARARVNVLLNDAANC